MVLLLISLVVSVSARIHQLARRPVQHITKKKGLGRVDEFIAIGFDHFAKTEADFFNVCKSQQPTIDMKFDIGHDNGR